MACRRKNVNILERGQVDKFHRVVIVMGDRARVGTSLSAGRVRRCGRTASGCASVAGKMTGDADSMVTYRYERIESGGQKQEKNGQRFESQGMLRVL